MFVDIMIYNCKWMECLADSSGWNGWFLFVDGIVCTFQQVECTVSAGASWVAPRLQMNILVSHIQTNVLHGAIRSPSPL